MSDHYLRCGLPEFVKRGASGCRCDLIDIVRADERERLARAWSWKDWPILTQSVKAGSVIGAAQAVTDWLRAQNGDSDEPQ